MNECIDTDVRCRECKALTNFNKLCFERDMLQKDRDELDHDLTNANRNWHECEKKLAMVMSGCRDGEYPHPVNPVPGLKRRVKDMELLNYLNARLKELQTVIDERNDKLSEKDRSIVRPRTENADQSDIITGLRQQTEQPRQQSARPVWVDLNKTHPPETAEGLKIKYESMKIAVQQAVDVLKTYGEAK